METPLVELVEHHGANAFEEGVGDQLPVEDPLGDNPQASRRADPPFKPDLVAHLVPERPRFSGQSGPPPPVRPCAAAGEARVQDGPARGARLSRWPRVRALSCRLPEAATRTSRRCGAAAPGFQEFVGRSGEEPYCRTSAPPSRSPFAGDFDRAGAFQKGLTPGAEPGRGGGGTGDDRGVPAAWRAPGFADWSPYEFQACRRGKG